MLIPTFVSTVVTKINPDIVIACMHNGQRVLRLRYPDGAGQIITPKQLEDDPDRIAKWLLEWMKEHLKSCKKL